MSVSPRRGLGALVLVAVTFFFLWNGSRREPAGVLPGDLRPFPYPYTAMLSLQSHIDGTTPEEFEAVHKYLNTYNGGTYGIGMALDVGDSLWLYNANDGVAYRAYEDTGTDAYMTWFSGTDPEKPLWADQIAAYWHMGWIDSIHSYGDFSRRDVRDVKFTRELAQKGLAALAAAGIHPTVWINHGNEANVQNFGGHSLWNGSGYQAGDNPASPYYHTDLLLAAGVRYLWNSHNSGYLGTPDPLTLMTLRDGQPIWRFEACTGRFEGGSFQYTWTPYVLNTVLTQENLEHLAASYQFSIIATHFGSGSLWEMMGDHNLPALQRLRDFQNEGRIAVIRSSRLLDYAAARKCVAYENDGTNVDILRLDDPVRGSFVPDISDVRGLTFYVNSSQTATLTIAGTTVDEEMLTRSPADETGRESIAVRWWG